MVWHKLIKSSLLVKENKDSVHSNKESSVAKAHIFHLASAPPSAVSGEWAAQCAYATVYTGGMRKKSGPAQGRVCSTTVTDREHRVHFLHEEMDPPMRRGVQQHAQSLPASKSWGWTRPQTLSFPAHGSASLMGQRLQSLRKDQSFKVRMCCSSEVYEPGVGSEPSPGPDFGLPWKLSWHLRSSLG